MSYVAPSLEEQIFESDVVVRASLLSATAETETVPSGEGVSPTYRAVQRLSFTIHEYLMGTGPSEAEIVVRGKRTNSTRTQASSVAQAAVSRRNTTWDGRQGILFLETLNPPFQPAGGASGAEQGATAPAYAFAQYNYGGETEWHYSIDTLSRVWLPASGDSRGPTGQSSDNANQEFIIDGSVTPPPVVSLTGLRGEITEFEAEMEAGEGITGFKECVSRRILRERHRRAVPWTPILLESSLDSGLAAGTEINRRTFHHDNPRYDRFWLSGPDMDLFQALIVDSDSDPSSGYSRTINTARPLPEGVYRLQVNRQVHVYFPCNFVPDDSYIDWTVTVTAPSGTLHEAFFDPGAAGAAVGFSAVGGSLAPAGFSVRGAATSTTGLQWQNGSVVLTLAPYAPLTGYDIDFIAPDGSATLTLSAAAASANIASGTLTWSVADQPWHDGDQLMLRIREHSASP